MRKILIAVLFVSLSAVPCFAAASSESRAATSSDVILENIVKSRMADTGVLLLALGRAQKSPVLLAAAAEFFADGDVEIETSAGKVNSALIYQEAIEAAKKGNKTILAAAFENESRIGKDRAYRWQPGVYEDMDTGLILAGWHWEFIGGSLVPRPNRPGRFPGEIFGW
jgi:hypothetical protein